MKKRVLFLLALLPAMGLYAYDFQYGDLYYHITRSDGIVEVTYENKYSSYEGLTSVTIPATVTYDGITYSVNSIGQYAFSGCTSLTSITIPNSVTSIRWSAFDGCSGLTSITIPNGVTSIGSGAFSNCGGLSSVIWNAKSCEDFDSSNIPFSNQITSFTFGDSVGHIPAYLCYGMENLTSLTIPTSVTSIGVYAFRGCTNLTSVVWNAKSCGVSIDEYEHTPFFNCTSITSFIISDSIEHIPAFLCHGIESLTSVTIPNNVTSIGGNAFSDCTGLTSITIPNSVTSIGVWAFHGCTSLTSVTIPNSVTSIEAHTFSDCTSLTSITIPYGVTNIENYAFRYCIGLASITIPNSVTSIGEDAFEGVCNVVYTGTAKGSPWGAKIVNGYVDDSFVYDDATKMTLLRCSLVTTGEIIIPNSVTSIADMAFYGCTGLTSVSIGNSVTSIGEYAFFGCTGLTSVEWNAKSFKVDGSNHSPFDGICSQITSFTFGDSVEHIPAYLCHNMQELTTITIPNSVTTIGDYAFYNCTDLTSISFGKNITKIGKSALNGCSNLQSVDWNIAADTIVSPFFYEDDRYYGGKVYLCPQITSFTFGDDVKSIPDAICSNMSLTTVSIPDNVTHIGDEAFKECGKLSSVTIGKNVKRIDSEAFRGCDSLKSVHFQGTLSDWANIDFEGYDMDDNQQHKGANPLEYADSLFIDNSYVTDITIPEGVTAIKRCAFFGYAGLQSLKLPNSLKEIGDGAFYGCTSLASTLLLPNVTSIGQWAFRSTGIQGALNIPHSVTTLGDKAFLYCAGIDTLIIGNGIADINNQFWDCGGITYLQLGSGMKTIAHNAFYDAKKLKRIVCYAIEPPVAQVQDGWNNGSFYNYNIHVQVPCDNLEDYETDAVWGSFKYLECVGAEKTETNGKVLVTPRDNDADITWPTNSSAATYTILITQDDMEICTLVFNADGQLTRIAFAAPARNGEQRRTPAALLTQDGYRFTVTGLSSATQYAYAIDVKDAKSNVLNTYKGSFTTTGGATGIDDVPATDETLDSDAPRKVFRDGQVYILRGGKAYTLTGEEVE